MNPTPTLPVPSSSRPRSVSRSSDHSEPDGFHDHPIATAQEPLLPQTNAPDQVSQPSYAKTDVFIRRNEAKFC